MLTLTLIHHHERLSRSHIAGQGGPRQCPPSTWLVPQRQFELKNVVDNEVCCDFREEGSWRVSTGEGFSNFPEPARSRQARAASPGSWPRGAPPPTRRRRQFIGCGGPISCRLPISCSRPKSHRNARRRWGSSSL